MNAPAPRKNVRLLVGVDGGGSGCRARIADAEGCVLGSGIAGPAAVRLGIDRSLAAVESACRAAAAEARLQPDALAEMDAGVGLARIGRQGGRAAIRARAHHLRPPTSVQHANT